MDILETVLLEIWGTLCEMAPFLLFGFLVAGVLSVFISPQVIEKHLGGKGLWPVVKASFFGVPLPLCSCSVIPVAASLRRHGSSKGATSAFLLSTPQTGVDSIMATYSLLGLVFAVFRPLAAFVSGVVGGVIVGATGREGDVDGEEKETCEEECCHSHGNSQPKLLRVLRYGFVVLPRDIAWPLLIGLVIAGGIAAAVPQNFFADALGTGFLAMLVMMVLGMPLYVCATASIPVAAAMMVKGITPGAALVFLMTGPATNAAAISTLWKMFGRRTALIYLCVVAVSALLSGVLLDYVFQVTDVTVGNLEHWMLPQGIKSLSAVILLAILFVAVLAKGKKHDKEHSE